MKKTYQECFEFFRVASQWISRHGEDSKFKYALTKVSRKVQKLQERYRDEVEEKNIESCATDKEGVILRDEQGQYKFTKDELIKRNREVNKLFRTEVDIEPHIAVDVPDDLTELEREVFEDFVLKSEQAVNLEVVNS